MSEFSQRIQRGEDGSERDLVERYTRRLLELARQELPDRLRGSVLGDAIPPVTTATLDTPANVAGWHNTDVTVSLSAEDNPGGSGVQRILYSIDGGEAVSVFEAATSFTLTEEGQHTIVFQAVDVVGNYEAPRTLQINIDKTPGRSARRPIRRVRGLQHPMIMQAERTTRYWWAARETTC